MTIGPRPPVTAVPKAILPDGRELAPDSYTGGYHGTAEVPPEVALKTGLPAHGDNWNLLDHVLQRGNSAFRGTTTYVTDPERGAGAAYWAGEGGWVYDVAHVPTWDVNLELEGRCPMPDGSFKGNLMVGENEYAIPAAVSPEHIRRWGKVEADPAGHLIVHTWHDNPAFR